MSYYWHDEGSPHESLCRLAKSIEDDQTARWAAHREYASLYKDRSVAGFSPATWRHTRSGHDTLHGPVTYNVVRSCVDTMTAKICLSRPMPKILTSAASAKKQEAARQLERFVWGTLAWNNAWEVASQVFRDACLYGDGYLYVREENKRIVIERIHPSNILVDDASAMNGVARTMLHRDWYSRDALIALYPGMEREIGQAESDSSCNNSNLQRDLVKVVQGWQLGDAGRHVVAINTATLVDDPWKSPRFPIAPVRWSHDLAGWHGTGLGEELIAIQLEINSVLRSVSDGISLHAVPYMLCPRSAGITEDHWKSNEPGRIMYYDGPTPPTLATPPGINEQVLSYLERLYQRAFEITGISLLDATSQKPSGLYSGAALNTYLDVTTQRFSQKQRRWENGFVDLAWLTIDAGKSAESLDGVVFSDPDGKLGRVDFDGIDLDDDSIEVQIYAASSLTKEMSGRIQDVVNLVQAGVVDQPNAAELLANPDLDKFTRLNNAPLGDLQMIFETMLETGTYIPPLEYQDCSLGIKTATRYWARARIRGVNEERAGLLEMWMDDAAGLLSVGKGKPPEALPAPEQSNNPMAMPAMPNSGGAPPVAPLIGD